LNTSKKIFKSRVDLDGSILRPEKLVFCENGVTFKKPNWFLITKRKTFISYSNLTSFKLKRGLVKAEVIFKSNDSTEIKAKALSIKDAKEIKLLIKNNTNLPRLGYV
jgi:hypothetical protein